MVVVVVLGMVVVMVMVMVCHGYGCCCWQLVNKFLTVIQELYFTSKRTI